MVVDVQEEEAVDGFGEDPLARHEVVDESAAPAEGGQEAPAVHPAVHPAEGRLLLEDFSAGVQLELREGRLSRALLRVVRDEREVREDLAEGW